MKCLRWIIPFLLLLVSACTPEEDTTANRNATEPTQPNRSLRTPPAIPTVYDFDLTDVDWRTTHVHIENDRVTFDHIGQSKMLIHLFSTRADLCRIQLPYLNDLQRHHPEWFVLGIVVPEAIDAKTLRRYMLREGITFFISHTPDNVPFARWLAHKAQLGENYPLPLTFLFENGNYVTHYEGITPVEMIEYDLRTLHTNSTAKGTGQP